MTLGEEKAAEQEDTPQLCAPPDDWTQRSLVKGPGRRRPGSQASTGAEPAAEEQTRGITVLGNR